MKPIKVAVIIVLFHPSQEQIRNLKRFYEELKLKHRQEVIVVDNTPNQDLSLSEESLIYLPLRENRGIAFAQNIGIKKALKLGCSHLVFFDQDSILDNSYFQSIIDEYSRISNFIPNLFLLGPTVINGRNGKEYKSAIHRDSETLGFKPRINIISSGSCVDISKITKVGYLDESLFIDGVDHEWCWRATSKGYISGITSNVTLTHYVGQNEFKIFGIQIILSSTFRYYYQTRNWLWLIRRDYVPRRWKINTSIKRLIYPLFFPFITKKWKEIYINIWRGVKDGLSKQNN